MSPEYASQQWVNLPITKSTPQLVKICKPERNGRCNNYMIVVNHVNAPIYSFVLVGLAFDSGIKYYKLHVAGTPVKLYKDNDGFVYVYISTWSSLAISHCIGTSPMPLEVVTFDESLFQELT